MEQLSFLQKNPVEISLLPDADVTLIRDFLSPDEAATLFARLNEKIPWRQDVIQMFGKTHNVPRLQQWFADEGFVYTWSGIRMEPLPWLIELRELRERLLTKTEHHFNNVLANLYRNGNDTVGWHSDDEPELGAQPTIASISLGAQRDFVLRHRMRSDVPNHKISLPSGSLLLMKGDTQRCWQHSVPRRKNVDRPRINLTFRAVQAVG